MIEVGAYVYAFRFITVLEIDVDFKGKIYTLKKEVNPSPTYFIEAHVATAAELIESYRQVPDAPETFVTTRFGFIVQTSYPYELI